MHAPAPGDRPKGPNRLYKNMGDGTFRDATESSGLGFAGFCHAIIVGDLDNDGDSDVFLANYGPNVLYRNKATAPSATSARRRGSTALWSSGERLLDYDNDGDLDVYLANYGEWSLPKDDLFCGDPSGRSGYARRGRSGRPSTSSTATTAT
ncbi:MAG: VCBS repeat-containing protein [Singulisphaera sp.]